MITIIFAFLVFIISISFPKTIHKYNKLLYVLSGIIALIFYGEEANVFSLGFIPLSFMIVVMYTGVFQKGIIKKKLMTVRAENAIIGFIFLLPHAIGFLDYYLDDARLFDNIVPVIGLSAFIISIPLFTTSFRYVRKQFKYKQWKLIHQLAYVFYILLFVKKQWFRLQRDFR